ncbi:MAG: glycosyltransferase family 2 protein [Deltaproteobacteria bacterium]|nr:glycosyltransferase family 2 protein [Deltaproteobacteria bacterium]
MPRLSVIIPAYNEAQRLGPTLDQLRDYFATQSYDAEVLVVDDGSEDGTRALAEARKEDLPYLRVIANDRNRGKGYTVKHGIHEATGDILLFFDADASTPIDQIEKFFPKFDEGVDVVIGSRSLPDSDVQVHQPFYRESMGRIFNIFVQLIVLRGIIDTQCGFKAFRREAAREIFPRQRLEGFGFDVEVLFLARKLGYQIREVPIVWINSPASRVHAVLDSTRMFTELLLIRLNDLRGLYGDSAPAKNSATAPKKEMES